MAEIKKLKRVITKKPNEKVSIIILNYNGKKYLKEYFDSVYKQILLPFEVVLMDNSSVDGSLSLVREKFPKVKIVENSFNAGTAEGSNLAFDRIKGDYVVFQSNDIRLDPNCLQQLVKTLEENSPDVGIVTSVFLKYVEGRTSKNNPIDNAGGESDIYGFGTQKHPGKTLSKIPETGEVFFSYGSSFIIRSKLFRKVGGFDKRFFTLNDDLDLNWRLRLQGLKIMYTKKSFVYHHGSATLKSFGQSKLRFLSERNALRTLIKNYSLINLFSVIPRYLFLEFGEISFYLVTRRFDLAGSVIKAIFWNVINLKDSLIERGKVQSSRKIDDNLILSKLSPKSYKISLMSSALKSGYLLRKDSNLKQS